MTCRLSGTTWSTARSCEKGDEQCESESETTRRAAGWARTCERRCSTRRASVRWAELERTRKFVSSTTGYVNRDEVKEIDIKTSYFSSINISFFEFKLFLFLYLTLPRSCGTGTATHDTRGDETRNGSTTSWTARE